VATPVEPARFSRVPNWTSAIAEDIANAAYGAEWITEADHAAVKTAIELAVTYESGHPEVASALMNALSLLGLTPIGRQRLKMPPDKQGATALDDIADSRPAIGAH